MFVSYGILIVFMFFSDIKIFARITLSPLTVFAIVTFSEKYLTDLDRTKNLLLHLYSVKNKKGESMPSRHTACAFIIAMAFMYVSIPIGIAYLIISALIMISRVLAGVHFISDVIAGMAISLLYGYFSFFII